MAFLIGDSHAASIKNGIERAVQEHMIVSWVGITGNACGLLYSTTSGICHEANTLIMERLNANLRSGDVVFLSTVGYKYWDATAQAQQRAYLRNLYTTVLQPRNARLVIMGDPPRLPVWAIYCLQAPSNCYAGTANNDQNRMLAPVADEFAGVLYVEIHDLFCDSNNCMAQVPGTTTYAFFDDSHLTEAGGLYLWPYICSALESAGFI